MFCFDQLILPARYLMTHMACMLMAWILFFQLSWVFRICLILWWWYLGCHTSPVLMPSQYPHCRSLSDGCLVHSCMQFYVIYVEVVADASSSLELVSISLPCDYLVEEVQNYAEQPQDQNITLEYVHLMDTYASYIELISSVISRVPLSSWGRSLVFCWLCIAPGIHRSKCVTLNYRLSCSESRLSSDWSVLTLNFGQLLYLWTTNVLNF